MAKKLKTEQQNLGMKLKAEERKIGSKLKTGFKKLGVMLTRNIGVKLLSFLLAFLIWVTIMSISDPQTTKKIEGIEIQTLHREDYNALPENVNISLQTDEIGTLSIKVTGKRSEVENLGPSDFVATVDFNDFVGNEGNALPIVVIPRSSSLADSLEITYQSRNVLQVKRVQSETKMISVSVNKLNAPDDKYALIREQSSNSLEITGPKEIVDSVSKLVADVDISTMTSKKQRFMIQLYPVDSTGARIDDASIELKQKTVEVQIELLAVKEVPLTVDYTDPAATQVMEGFAIYDFEYNPKTIRIAADDEMLDELEDIVIKFTTEDPLMKTMQPVSKNFNILKYLPDGVYLKSDTSDVIATATVEPTGEKTLTIAKSKIEYRNLPEGLRLPDELLNELEDGEEVEITVKGFKTILDTITSAEQLKPFVDLKNVTNPNRWPLTIEYDIDDQYQNHPNRKPKIEADIIEIQIFEALPE
ncbi:MAG: hypothetical protein J5648_08820 [Lachnospiraceae bacterium]|nr:hypothetical protein [Lachnospiraceae bacterium]